jgi:NH3-dependent NAD+ synthetase
MDQGEVYFLKMNSGEDLLCTLVGDEQDYLYVTQPYRVEIMQTPATMTVTTAIMRWIPFESLMEQTICLDKKNVLTYMLVDDIVASKYLNTIDQQARKEREEQAEKIRQMLMMQAIQRIANNSPTGSIH